MNTGRFELYTPIHKALRRLMSNMVVNGGAADWRDPEQVASIQAQWDLTMMLVASHHHHEDEFIHPLLAKAAPGAHREIEREHEEQSRTRADLAEFLGRIASCTEPECARQLLGAEFVRALYLYYADLLQHMHREEVDAQRLLDAHYSPAELAHLNKQIVASVPPNEMMATIDAMFPALNLDEQTAILGGIKADAPPPAFAAISDRVHQAIGDDAWAKLAHRLGA